MSDNNNNNDVNSNNNSDNEESNGNGGNDNNDICNNNNDDNNNCRSNRNNGRNNNGNSENDNDKVKGACEELGHDVFDCTSRKQMEACNNTLKAMAMHVGTGKEHGKQADSMKCTVEKGKEPTKN